MRGPVVAGSSPSTLTTSLATPVPSSSSSNGPTTTPLTTRLPYYCTSICVRSCCNWRASSVDSISAAFSKFKRHTRNGPRTHECCFEVVLFFCFVLWLLYWSRRSHSDWLGSSKPKKERKKVPEARREGSEESSGEKIPIPVNFGLKSEEGVP